MDCILVNKDGGKTAIYAVGSKIYFTYLTAGRGRFTAVLAKDYQSNLAACSWDYECCFSYLNTQGELLVRRIGREKGRLLYRQMWNFHVTSGGIRRPSMVRCGGRCFLLYLEERKDMHRECLVLLTVEPPGEPYILEEGTGFAEYFVWGREEECSVMLIKEKGNISRWKWNGEFFTEEDAVWSRQDMEQKTRFLEAQYEKKYAEMQNTERQIRRKLEKEQEKIREDIVVYYEEKVSALRLQYEELARVTRQLQEAGKKWRDMYFDEM